MQTSKAKLVQIRKFFSQFPTIKFSRNQTILKPGDEFENIYFIKSGYVKASTMTAKGENTLNLFKPLFLLSMIHLVSEHNNDYFFKAITPVEIYVAPYSDVIKIIEKDKKINSLLMSFMGNSLLSFLANQSNIVGGSAQNKIASVLLQLSNDYGDIKNSKLVVNFPATHRVIANLVGLTRETTSVQMSRLQKLGIVSTKRTHFTINNLDKLKKLTRSSE